MNYKFLLIVFSWLATITSLFLFSRQNFSFKNLDGQASNIIETITIPTTSPPKPKAVNPIPKTTSQTTAPLLTQIQFTPLPTLIVTTSTTTSTIPPTITSATSATTTSSTTTSTFSPTPAPTSSPEQSQKININTANSQELEKITGIGPVIAQRIVEYREKNGPFQKIEDIKNVNGIGDVKFEKMKNEITI